MASFVDTFDRADAALHGSTLSGGGATWDASTWQVLSNRADVTNLGAFGSGVAVTSGECDSDDMFVQVDLGNFVAQAGDLLAWGLYLGIDPTHATGYVFRSEIETDGSGYQAIIRLSDDSVVASATVAAYTSGTFRFERAGDTLRVLRNGTVILGPTLDATPEAKGAGRRYVGINAFCLNGSTPNNVALNDFNAGGRRWILRT